MQHNFNTVALAPTQGKAERRHRTMRILRTPRNRWLRQTLRVTHNLRQLHGALLCFVVLHWAAAVFLTASLLHFVAHRGLQWTMMLAATLTGPLTLFGVLQHHRRLHRQRGQQDRLMHQARHDDLTGLPNRNAMRQHMQHLLNTMAGDDASIACFYLDLDGIRHANTLLGYQAGDELLERIVERVGGCLAPTDHFSRFGGDKFVVLLQRTLTRAATEALANAIINAVARPQRLNGQQFTTGVSIGIASCSTASGCTDALLAEAERAMYAVKHSGRSGFNFYQTEDSSNEARKCMLTEKLQRALQTGGLELHYQPIFSAGGELIAAEALCRWNDEEEGPISPGEFIPLAESSGLIVPLTRWVLHKACEQMQSWRMRGGSLQRIAVNICVLHASRNDFVATVEDTLADTGLPSRCLELEVTENALARDFESVSERLNHLRTLGIRIAIDDFGTGYSSFGRLRDLRVDALKIDRVFVHGARETHNGIDVLQAIVRMAHALQLSVVAEGVETAEQRAMLQDIGCDELQGFLLGRPQPARQFEQLLRLSPAEAPSPGFMPVAFDAHPA